MQNKNDLKNLDLYHTFLMRDLYDGKLDLNFYCTMSTKIHNTRIQIISIIENKMGNELEMVIFKNQTSRCKDKMKLEQLLGRLEMTMGLTKDPDRKAIIHQKKNFVKQRIVEILDNKKTSD